MYTEKVKNKVREMIFNEAVDNLTKNRDKSTITSLEYFDAVEHFMLNDSSHPEDHILAGQLEPETKEAWKKHFTSILSSKKAAELRVAYLAGPNPENDLKELCKLGVLPENIWAFESQNKLYVDAIRNLLKTYPQVKIHKGKIDVFFENTAVNFDIVYLDFCGTFFSSNKENKSIATIISLLDNHRLNSPGVLITNFAFLDNDNSSEMRSLVAKVVALYLYPKDYADMGLSAQEQGLGFTEWFNKVSDNLDYYYSEFIRRFMMDLTSVIIPFMRIIRSKGYHDMFFSLDGDKFEICKKNLFGYDHSKIYEEKVLFGLEDDCGGYLASEMSFYPIPWFFEMARSKDLDDLKSFAYEDDTRDLQDNLYSNFYDDKFVKCIINLINQITNNDPNLIDKLCVMLYLIGSECYGRNCYSDKLQKISNMEWLRIAPQACDVFTFQSVIGLLLGQLSVPYHINVLQTKGVSYRAKKTKMYTDVFVLDTCRYIYDMLPTIDMLIERLYSISPQICYRFALDALDKNHIRYNNELFYGCAVVGCNHNGFEERWFCERENILE